MFAGFLQSYSQIFAVVARKDFVWDFFFVLFFSQRITSEFFYEFLFFFLITRFSFGIQLRVPSGYIRSSPSRVFVSDVCSQLLQVFCDFYQSFSRVFSKSSFKDFSNNAPGISLRSFRGISSELLPEFVMTFLPENSVGVLIIVSPVISWRFPRN